MDPKRVAANLSGHAHREQLKRDFYRAINLGINATPTVFVGDASIVGYHDADAYRYEINEALKTKGLKSPVPEVARPEAKAPVEAAVPEKMIYPARAMAPADSKLRVKVGEAAPDFTLPTTEGKDVRLSSFRGKKNVVLSFVPAAWTPVCSAQWPEYNENKAVFEAADAVAIGISVDNVPTLYAWTGQMGPLWFDVASDFYPHGATARKYGVLRSSGTTERAVILIDKKGIIRYIDVHDINTKPDFATLRTELAKLNGK
jgi:peroxiredoxin